jgi:hypothetical protein
MCEPLQPPLIFDAVSSRARRLTPTLGAGDVFQVLGHDSIQTMLRFYIHTSANAAGQNVGKMINVRWNVKPKPQAAG